MAKYTYTTSKKCYRCVAMQPLQPKTKELNYFSNMSMILDVQLSANKLKQ